MRNQRPQIIILLSVLLLLPAVLFCTGGMLSLVLGWTAVNDWLTSMTAHGLLRLAFSPSVVLGGPFLAVLLNVPELCSLTIAFEHGEWLVAFAIKRVYRHLIPVVLGGMLLSAVLAYGFVENFRIVPR